jgi:uncharacterized protein (TIGR02231 family)
MVKLNTAITAVTVYPDRARVQRSGSAHPNAKNIQPGKHMLEIPELPLTINPDSLRAAARGSAQAHLLGVQVQRAFFTETPAENVRQLETQIEVLEDELRGFDARAKLVKKNQSALDALGANARVYATALASGEMTLESQIALFEGIRQKSEKLIAELLEIDTRKREMNRRLEKLKSELEQQRSSRPRERYTATVEVEVLQAGTLALELNYVVAGAGWKPLYDLRLVEGEELKTTLEVSYLAQVSQRSGEAWNDVFLMLSTARPALASMLPELDPWYIAPLQVMAVQAQPRSAPALKQVSLAMFETAGAAAPAAEADQERKISYQEARVDSSGAAVTFSVPGKVGIPDDGAPHKVNVASYTLVPRLDYIAAPKIVEATYRRAKLINDSLYTLLPGQANLYHGEEFIGSTQLELTAPQGEIELYLGVDDRIKVKRELKRRDVDKRLIGGKRHIVYGYETTLENLLSAPAQVTLKDNTPVSRQEDIKVRLEYTEPRPAEQTELNELTWEFVLQVKEKRAVRYDFSVEYPQGMEVLGLP